MVQMRSAVTPHRLVTTNRSTPSNYKKSVHKCQRFYTVPISAVVKMTISTARQKRDKNQSKKYCHYGRLPRMILFTPVNSYFGLNLVPGRTSTTSRSAYPLILKKNGGESRHREEQQHNLSKLLLILDLLICDRRPHHANKLTTRIKHNNYKTIHCIDRSIDLSPHTTAASVERQDGTLAQSANKEKERRSEKKKKLAASCCE